ncbi:MAG: hypothetical protein KDD51_07730 [Bdellovibrionales bacterium]|nr:hypothetical protein [Bdellovibrionales bacterium]
MKGVTKILSYALFMLVVAACAQSSSTTAPTPLPPGSTVNNTPFPENQVYYSGNLPDLTSAVAVNLLDKTNFSALYDMVSDFTPPLVADPLVKLDLKQSGTDITGTILFSIEDDLGFWGAIIGSFGNTGHLQNNVLDVIFADDEMVMRTIGSVSGNTLSGHLYYRMRASGENQCKPVVVYCDVTTQSGSPYWWYPAPTFPAECTQTPNVDTPCLSYMNTSASAVKKVGTFVNTSFSQWVE